MNAKRLFAATALAATVVGVPAVALANVGGFDDVPDDHQHAAGIQWLVDNGITSGCDADSFCPGDPLTRAQMGTFMRRLSGNGDVAPSVNATSLDGLDSSAFVSGVEIVENAVELQADSFENVTVMCPAGKSAIAGGYQLRLSDQGALSTDWYAVADHATDAGDGWVVSVRTLDDAPHNAYVTVTATCVA